MARDRSKDVDQMYDWMIDAMKKAKEQGREAEQKKENY